MKRFVIAISCLSLTTACVPAGQQGPSPEHGFGSMFLGIAHLVLSPVQIAAGLLEGIASVPFYMTMGVHEINAGMVEAQSAINLDDTYESAYGKRLTQVADDGDTGEVFSRMKHASNYFQKVLHRYGVPDADRYILTSIDTANNAGYGLFAVVYRPVDTITVQEKSGGTRRTFTREDRLFYEPYREDANGRTLDTVIDWAGVPRDTIRTQKAQAVLLTMAANTVAGGRKSPDYWEAERRWMAGEYLAVTDEKMAGVRERMKLGNSRMANASE